MTAPGRLYLHRLTYRDFLGQAGERTVDFDDDLTIFAGPNGAGKSTVLAALMVALSLDQTAIARYIHLGPGEEAMRPEINLWLRDGAGKVVTHIRVRPSGRDVKTFDGADWKIVRKPVEYIVDLRDPAALTSTFREAPIEEKVTMLLEAIADRVPYDRIQAIASTGVGEIRFDLPDGLTWLEELERIEKTIYDTRTATNSEKQRKKDLAQELLSTLPAEAPEGVEAEMAEVEKKTRDLAAEVAAAEARIDSEEREKLAASQAERSAAIRDLEASAEKGNEAARAAHAQKAGEMRAEVERRIAKLAEELAAEVDDRNTKMVSAAEEIRRLHDADDAETRAAASAARDALGEMRSDLGEARLYEATLRERATRAASDAEQRSKATAAQQLAEQHARRSDQLTEAIAALRRYKAGLAADTGIPGLRIHFPPEGVKGKPTLTLAVDGADVPLDQINTGRMEELALAVTELRSKSPENGRPHLLLAILDNAEALDPSRLRAKAGRGVQIVAAVRHGDGPGEPLRVVAGEAVVA